MLIGIAMLIVFVVAIYLVNLVVNVGFDKTSDQVQQRLENRARQRRHDERERGSGSD